MSLQRTNLVSVAVSLGSSLLFTSNVLADQHLTYVQNNGSLDGYYVADDQKDSSAGESTSESGDTSVKEEQTHTTVTTSPVTTTTSPVTNTTNTSEATTTADKTSPTPTTTASTSQTVWGQCGGLNYSGANCCQDGLTCVTLDSYWAHCISPSTLSSQIISTAASESVSLKGSLHEVTQRSTVYSYKIHSQGYKSVSTDVSGHKFTTELNSESTETVVEGFTNIIKMSNDTSGASPAVAMMNGETNWKLKLALGTILGLGVLAI